MKRLFFPVLCFLFSAACLFAQHSGTRDLPNTYIPEGAFNATLTVNVSGSPTGIVVTEFLPAGWSITGSLVNGTPDSPKYRPAPNSYEWTVIFPPAVTTIVYTVSVPAGASGFHSFSGTIFPDIPIGGDTVIQEEGGAIPGDINGDGEVNISDVILCLRISIGLPVTIGEVEYTAPDYSGDILAAADMNGQDGVNISDVILVLRKSIGLE